MAESLFGDLLPPTDKTAAAQPEAAPSSGAKPSDESLFGDLLSNQPKKPVAKAAAEPPVSTAEDVARSAGAGLERGTAALAGLPGDIGAAARWSGEELGYYGRKAGENLGLTDPGAADTYWKKVEADRASPDRDYVGYVPTSAATTKMAEENLPGAGYQAKTTTGKYVQSAAEVAPAALTALVPGLEEPFVAALGRAGIAGVGSEAAGEATAGSKYEPYARMAGALIAPMAAERYAAPGLGSALSKAGLSDENIRDMYLVPPSDVTTSKIVQEFQRLQRTGEYAGLSSNKMQEIREAEIAAGIPEDQSRIRLYMALSDSPSDVIKKFVNNTSMNREDINEEIRRLMSDHNQIADAVDQTASSLLGTMHQDSTLTALNRWRSENGIQDELTEVPPTQNIPQFARDVREGLYDKTFGEAYRQNPAVMSSALARTLEDPMSQSFAQMAQNAVNRRRNREGLDPVNFLSKDEETGLWKVGSQTEDGVLNSAPLEFWDKLARYAAKRPEENGVELSKDIQDAMDKYFKSKKMDNPLIAAREAYGDVREGPTALDRGSSFVQNLSPEKRPARRALALNEFDQMGDTEKALYQAGAMQQAHAMIRQGDWGIKQWNKLMSNADNRALAQEVFNWKPAEKLAVEGPARNFERLQSALDVGKVMKQEDVSKLLANNNSVKSYLSKLGSPAGLGILGVALSAAERAWLFGTPFGYVTMAAGGVNYIKQLMADQRARKFVNMLATRDPKQIIALTKEIESSPVAKTSWQKVKNLMNFGEKATQQFYRRAASTAPASQIEVKPFKKKKGHNTGGRVGYGPGGEIPPADPRAVIKQLVSHRDTLTPGTPEHTDVVNKIRQHSQAMAQARPQPQAPAMPAMRTPKIDETGMYSPSVKAILDTHQGDPTQLQKQYSPEDALQRAIKGGADRYELFHSNLMEDNGTPGKHLQGVNNLSMSQLADLLEQHSPKPQPHVYTGSNAVHTHMTSYWLPQDNKDQYEVAVKAPGRAGEPEKKKGFIPPIHLKQSDKDVELLDRFGYNHGYVWDENASTVPHQKIEDRLKMEQQNVDEKANAPYYFSNTSHYPQVPENRVMHTRGQVIEKKYVPEDINSILNEDETQSDFNARYREDQTYDKRHGTKDRHVYDPDEHRNLYHAAIKSEEELKKIDKELADAEASGMPITEDLRQKRRMLNNQAYNDRQKYRGYRYDVKKYPELPFGDDEDKYTRLANNLTVNRAINGGHDAVSWTPWQNQIVRNQRGMPVSGFNVVPIKNEFGRNLIRIYEKPWPGAEDQTKLHNDIFDVNNEDFEKNLAANFGKHAAKEMVKRLAANPDGFNLDWKEEEPVKQGGKGPKTVYHPLFVAIGDNAAERENNASKADKTIEYYGKTKSRIYRSMFHDHDPSMDIDNELFYHPETRSGLKFPHPGFKMTPKFVASVKGKGLRRFKQGGEVERPQRATGGRIPEVDKLFKAAKKTLDGETKPMLEMPDDAIVHALRIAQGRV